METLQVINARKSCRSFLPQQITEEQLAAILKAGEMAPMGMKRGVHLSVIQSPALLEEISIAAATAYGQPGIQPLYGAPTLIVAAYSPDCSQSLGSANTACAVENMLLAATHLNLGNIFLWTATEALPLNSELAKKCGIPEGYVAVSSAAVGYTNDDVQGETPPTSTITISRH